MRILLTVNLCIFIYVFNAFSQINFISGVPDHSQPPDTNLQSTTDVSNCCAPFAAEVYFYRLGAGDFEDVKKMILLR